MLTVRGLHAWYGPSHILQGIDLEVRRGEIVCLVGRNGAGKTTTLRSIMGLVDRRAGSVVFDGQELLQRPPHIRNGLGLGYVPEERRIVPGLTVRENLRLGVLAARVKRPGAGGDRRGGGDLPPPGRASGPDRHHHVRRGATDAGDRPRYGQPAEDGDAGRAV